MFVLRFNFRHRAEVCRSGRRGHPHHLWSSGSYVCPCGAGGLPVSAAAGLRCAAGAQHRSHPAQQQHARHGLGQAGGYCDPGNFGGAHDVVRYLQSAAFCSLFAVLHLGHTLYD